MSDPVELTLDNVEHRAKAGMQAALIDWGKTFQESLTKAPPAKEVSLANLEDNWASWPTQLEVKIDGKPVKADLVDGGYQIALGQASMKAGGLAGVVESGDNFKLLNISLGPITSAVVGTGAGLVIGGVIDRVTPPRKGSTGPGTGSANLLNVGAKLGAAGLAATYGAKYTGRTAAYFIAGALVVEVLLQQTQLGNLLVKLSDTLSKPFVGRASVVQHQSVDYGQPSNNSQAGQSTGALTSLAFR